MIHLGLACFDWIPTPPPFILSCKDEIVFRMLLVFSLNSKKFAPAPAATLMVPAAILVLAIKFELRQDSWNSNINISRSLA